MWTFEHFLAIVPAFVIMVVIALVLRKFLIDKPLHIRMIPFQVCTVILLILEVIKQIVSIGYNGEIYRLYSLPFHVCSLFLFLFPLMSFYKGKYSDVINTLACTISGALTIFMFILPTMLYPVNEIVEWNTNYLYFHTVFFHNLVLFMFILIVALKLHTPQKKSYLKEVVVFAYFYCMHAVAFSYLLQTNFSNFYSCNMPGIDGIVAAIKTATNDIIGQAVYVFVLIGLHIGFFILSYYVYKLISGTINKLTNKPEKQIE